ncbi:MAG: site-specific integrase [archaeon]
MPESLYDHEKKFKIAYTNAFSEKKSCFSESNKELLREFFGLLQAKGVSYGRLFKYVYAFKNICSWLECDLKDVTKEHLIKLAAVINSQKLKDSVKRDYKGSIKYFYLNLSILPKYEYLTPIYTWLYDKRLKFFSTGLNESEKIDEDERFTDEDIIKLLKVTKNPKYNCIFSVMATQGMRPSELLTMKRKGVEKTDYGFKLKIRKSKTKVREFFVMESFVAEAIQRYLDTLPEDTEYLFDTGLKMLQKMIKEMCIKAGIKKRAYPYKLRKYAVTRDRILGLSTAACEQKFGWKKGTRVISNYDKSVSIDYFNEMRVRYGYAKDNSVDDKFRERICIRCGEKNPFNKKFCIKCTLNLDTTKEQLVKDEGIEPEKVKALESRLEKMDRFIEWLESNKDLKKVIESNASR